MESEKLEEILTEERLDALKKSLDLLVKADELGIISTLNDVLEPDVLDKAINFIMSPWLLILADRLNEILEILARIDYEPVKENIDLINEVLQSVPKETKPVSLLGLLGALRDPDVQKGLGFAIGFLKGLGKKLSEKELKKE